MLVREPNEGLQEDPPRWIPLCCSHLRGTRAQLNTYLQIKAAMITTTEEENVIPATCEAP